MSAAAVLVGSPSHLQAVQGERAGVNGIILPALLSVCARGLLLSLLAAVKAQALGGLCYTRSLEKFELPVLHWKGTGSAEPGPGGVT